MVGNENPRTPPERSQVDASVAYNNISGAQKVPEIFEFKVDCLQIQSEISYVSEFDCQLIFSLG